MEPLAESGPELDADQLNRRWRPALMSFFLRRTRNHQEAEDLTQEVFTRLLNRTQPAEGIVDAYVFQIAANLLRDGARRSRVREEYRALTTPIEEQKFDDLDPARIVLSREALRAVVDGLETLPERTRTIFTLYRIENLQFEAIADTYGVSKSAVKKHVMRAMAALMSRMREQQ